MDADRRSGSAAYGCLDQAARVVAPDLAQHIGRIGEPLDPMAAAWAAQVAVRVNHARDQRGPTAIDDLRAGRINLLVGPEPLDASILDGYRDPKLELRRGPIRDIEQRGDGRHAGGCAGFVGLTTNDPERLRAAYLAMGIFSDRLIVPVNLAALLTGLVLALGTPWGLFRYSWVVTKLVFSLFLATASIFGLRARIAEAIGNVMVAPPSPGSVGLFLVVVLPIAVGIYVINTALATYKPLGEDPSPSLLRHCAAGRMSTAARLRTTMVSYGLFSVS